VLEFRLQGDRVGKLTRFDPARDRLVDASMDRIDKVFRGQEFRDPFIGFVIREKRAQQGLLRLGVRGRNALGEAKQWRVDGVHAGILAQTG
jgi:hypothetical protein